VGITANQGAWQVLKRSTLPVQREGHVCGIKLAMALHVKISKEDVEFAAMHGRGNGEERVLRVVVRVGIVVVERPVRVA
jgi:hypothetical protein